MNMKKILAILGVMLLVIGLVNATDCAGYFTKPADKRIKVLSSISSLELTTERLGSRADKLYNTLDDMNNDENLTYAADDFTELVNRKNDANSDYNDLKSSIDNYDNAISDSREDLPNACFKVFNLYDSDLGDMDDYFSNVRSARNKFLPRYDIVAGYRSNLPGHLVSEAKPKIDDLKDYIDDVSGEVTSNVPSSNINSSTTYISDEKIYNQTECFGMVTKNVDIATKDCVNKCNLAISKATLNCTQQSTATTLPTSCPDCNSAVLNVQSKLVECQNSLNANRQECPTCPVCQADASKDNRITSLTAENAQLNAKITDLNLQVSGANQKVQDMTVKLNSVAQCESCSVWKYIVGFLVVVMVLAWILAM